MRQNDSWLRLPVLILLATVIWTGWMYQQLPQVMAVINLDKLTGAWLLPGIMVIIWALWEVLPTTDRRFCQSRAFLEPYWSFGNMLLVLMAAMQWGVFQINLAPEFPFLRFIGWILVVLIAWSGRLLPLVPRNRVMGVCTPWALADAGVWRLTQRETARALRTTALFGIIFQVALPAPWNLGLILASLAGVLVWAVILSYLSRCYRSRV